MIVFHHRRSGGHIRILPRMPAAISALAYVHGMPAQLLCTSTDGSIYVADFKRPEDSYTAGVKLPLAASEVPTNDFYFLSPLTPFQLIISTPRPFLFLSLCLIALPYHDRFVS